MARTTALPSLLRCRSLLLLLHHHQRRRHFATCGPPSRIHRCDNSLSHSRKALPLTASLMLSSATTHLSPSREAPCTKLSSRATRAQQLQLCKLGTSSRRESTRTPGVRAQAAATSWQALPSVAAASLSVAALIMGLQLRNTTQLEIVGANSALNASLRPKLTELENPYVPYPTLTNRHVETIFAAFFRSLPRLTFRRECLRMPDGGTVALDWPQPDVSNPKAVLVLLPGLTGGSDDTYVQHLARRAASQGWAVVVFNSRGCADSPVTTPQFYSAAFTEDLRQVVKHVASLFPSLRVYATGWSLGANILTRYLGQEGERCPLSGAVSLCNPFDLVVADEDFHKGFNNIYDKSLARGLRKIFAKHAHLFKDIGGEFNIPLVVKSKTVRDFDEGLTRVSFGYKTVDDYYYDAGSARLIKDVRVPLLCIQASTDPIAPERGIPRADLEANAKCLLVVTPYGGHLGWISGPEAPLGCPWTDPLIMQYLEAVEDRSRDESAFSQAQEEAGDVQPAGMSRRKAVQKTGLME